MLKVVSLAPGQPAAMPGARCRPGLRAPCRPAAEQRADRPQPGFSPQHPILNDSILAPLGCMSIWVGILSCFRSVPLL